MSCFKYGVSVALPAYREAENLKVILPKLKSVLSGIPHEIIVVDTQQSLDDTRSVCMRCGEIYHVPREGGEHYGDAVRTAFSKAKFSYTVIMDADGSHNPKDILRMLAEIERSGCDLVIGSRYCKGGSSHNGILLKSMSWILNCTYRIVFGLKAKDISDSFRMYRTEEVKQLKLECENFDIVEEILIQLNETVKEFRIVEIPIYFSKRQSGESKRELGRFVVSYLKTMKRLYRIKKELDNKKDRARLCQTREAKGWACGNQAISIFQVIMNVTGRYKPFLIRILPLPMLQKAKKRYLAWSTGRLAKEKIRPFTRYYYKDGINLTGNIRGDFGLGQSCRLVAGELQSSGISFGICEYHTADDDHMDDHSCDALLLSEPVYNINLFHINANEFTLAYFRLGKQVWDYRYNIAFWLWELEEFPKEWVGCIDLLHEIWTPSEFVSHAVRKRTKKPVITIPYHVEAPTDQACDRDYFHLPKDQFLFLMMYDSNSIMERKNPVGVLKAFQMAFSREEKKAGLVIKMNSADQKEMEQIRQVLDGYENIYFLTEVLTKVEANSLTACVDVFVSMHRAEGFGLVMAEAMLLGVPCIATGWSANTEFMNADTACLLDYRRIPIREDLGPFRKGNYWADPDVHQAAQFMRRLYEDADFYHTIAKNAKEHAQKVFGMERAAGKIRERVREIYQGRTARLHQETGRTDGI